MTNAIKGRGATNNRSSARFNLPHREQDGDWLDAQALIDGEVPRPKTTVQVLHPKTIISRNQSPDLAFTQSINNSPAAALATEEHRQGKWP